VRYPSTPKGNPPSSGASEVAPAPSNRAQAAPHAPSQKLIRTGANRWRIWPVVLVPQSQCRFAVSAVEQDLFLGKVST
jgi:hypothetical protein